MFLCGYCKKQSKPGEKLTLLPDRIRRRLYDVNGKQFQGTEIVKEKKACQTCKESINISKAGDSLLTKEIV